MAGQGIKLTGDWALAQSLLNAGPAKVQKALKVALFNEAAHWAGQMKKNVGKGAAPTARPSPSR